MDELPKRMPAEVFSLAEHLYDELKARGWTTDDCALRMGHANEDEFFVNLMALDLLMAVQKDSLLVGDRLFACLSAALDVSEEFLRRLDKGWREHPARRSDWSCPDDVFGPMSCAIKWGPDARSED